MPRYVDHDARHFPSNPNQREPKAPPADVNLARRRLLVDAAGGVEACVVGRRGHVLAFEKRDAEAFELARGGIGMRRDAEDAFEGALQRKGTQADVAGKRVQAQVAFAGKREVYGLNNLVNGPLPK